MKNCIHSAGITDASHNFFKNTYMIFEIQKETHRIFSSQYIHWMQI